MTISGGRGQSDGHWYGIFPRRLTAYIAPCLLAVGLVTTGFIVHYVKRKAEQEARREFAFVANEIEHILLERLSDCEQILRSGAALFRASESVGRADWRRFVETLAIEQSLAGVQGVGFTQLIPRDGVAAHEAAIRSEGFPDYRLWPAGDREAYSAIVYLEPFIKRNLRAFGYDMFSEPVRRSAMERARDDYAAALSGKVVLVQEDGVGVQPGTLLYFPVYAGNLAPTTVEARRSALVGWVYSPYRMADLVKGALRGWTQVLEDRHIALWIYDGESLSPESLLYTNRVAEGASTEDGGDLFELISVKFAGRQWKLRLTQIGGLAATADYRSTWLALLGGASVSALAFGLALSLQRTSERAEEKAMRLTQELRQAADRLALATRAGGVGIWDYDAVENRLHWDDQMFRVYGRARPDFDGTVKSWAAMLHPEDKASAMDECDRAVREAHGLDTEFRVIWADGSIHHIRAFGKVQVDDAGRAVRMIGTNWDITESKRSEAAIQQIQSQLSLAMSLASLVHWEMDAATRTFVFNDAFYALYGTTAAREGGLRMPAEEYALRFLPPGEQHLVAASTRGLLNGEVQELTLEHRIVRRDGAIRFVAVKAVAIRDPAGRVIGTRGANQDITALREKEGQLADQNVRWREALLATMDGYLETDHDGHILEANPAYVNLSGYTATELAAMSIAELEAASTPEDFARFRNEIQQLGSKRFRTSHRRKDGSICILEVSATYSARFDGRFYYFCRDVTMHQEAERRLRLQTTALEAAANVVVITDADGRIEWVNDAFVRATGYTREEARGKNPRILKSDRHPKEFYQNMWETLLSGQVWRGELVNRRRDGTVILEEAIITPVSGGEGRITHFVAIKQDITERKNIEHQLLRSQRMEAIGLLAGGIAHDLNNILTPILLSVELLKPSLKNAEDRETLDLVGLSARRGAGIVKQVLTFARGIDGERSPIRPVDLIREVAAIVAETFPREITITREVPDLDARVAGDVTQLHQVLLNLSVNARDAMPQGGMLTLGLEVMDAAADFSVHTGDLKAGSYVVIKVRDTGNGIAPEVRHRIFEPFFTTKPQGKGTGLGLPTALGIVRSHGGAIDIHSEIGRGSEFRIYLPALPVDKVAETISAPPPALEGKGRAILVVDDEPAIRGLAKNMLEKIGFRVLEAGNGREALATFARDHDRIDAIVTDIMMPLMSGDRLAEIIWRQRPEVPILFMSGLTEQDEIDSKLRKLRQREVVLARKPFEMADFIRHLSKALEPARSPEADASTPRRVVS